MFFKCFILIGMKWLQFRFSLSMQKREKERKWREKMKRVVFVFLLLIIDLDFMKNGLSVIERIACNLHSIMNPLHYQTAYIY